MCASLDVYILGVYVRIVFHAGTCVKERSIQYEVKPMVYDMLIIGFRQTIIDLPLLPLIFHNYIYYYIAIVW